MKITIKLDLNDEDDKQSYKLLNQRSEMYCFIEEFMNILRNYYKYGIPEEIDTKDKLLELLRDKFHELLQEYEIKI